MIITTELTDCFVEGYPSKEIRISYVNKNGGISWFNYQIPKADLYNWKYAGTGDVQDTRFVSWDKKPVAKVYPKNGNLTVQRIHEILLDLEKKDPNIGAIHELQVPEIAFCDIETDVDDSGFPEASEARNRINTISWVNRDVCTVLCLAKLSEFQISDIQQKINKHCEIFDTTYKFVYKYYETESTMLLDFMRSYVFNMPAITGWNFVDFDWQYIVNRCKILNIDISWLSNSWGTYTVMDIFHSGKTMPKVPVPNHKLIFDYKEIYFKWDTTINPKESFKLDDVGFAACGVKKVQHDMGFQEMWEKYPDLHVFYNAVDSILVREIDKKLKTAMIMYSLANLIHCDCIVAFSPVRSLEIVQCETMYAENRVVPKMERKDEEHEKYAGAFVYDPIPGIYKNVIALDFASLYPTTMRQFNISPDTYVKKDKDYIPKADEIKCASGAVYKRNEEGILPKILTNFYNQRKAYKKEMKIATQEMYDLMDIYESRVGKSVDE